MTTSITRFHLLLAGLLLVLWTIGGSADELTNRPTEGDAPALVSQRAPWTTSQITGVPDPPPYETKLVFPHLQFSKPVVLTKAPGIDRWFLAELAGRIVSFSDDSKVRQTDLFVDLAAHIDDVQHIYGMTFHPDFEQNRFVYICYLTGQGFRGDARVSRFKVTGDSPPQCDPRSEQLLLKWPTGGHNGGCLKFGPDGYLYISTGDGAAPSPPDPEAVGQNLADLKSSILRIDVDRTSPGLPYRIPEDNPFVDLKNARPEIWAYGFRNPWKMNFDGLSGDLWLGDVGWESWEMVHRIERGGNYGWSIMEGPLPIRPEAMRGPTPVQPPVVALPRSEAASVTGGQVYRGSNFPEIQGAYIFGDYETRKVWATRLDAEGTASTEEIAATDLRLITFGEDEQGELYLVDYDKGTVHQLKHREPNPEKPPFPETLSQTGLFSSTANHSLHPGVVPFSVNASQWLDGAIPERFVALPHDTSIRSHSGSAAAAVKGPSLEFPEDAVLARTLSLEMHRGHADSRRRIETQLLHFHQGVWRGYTYTAGTRNKRMPPYAVNPFFSSSKRQHDLFGSL